MRPSSWVWHLLRVWKLVQVELHGRYSVQRLRDVVAHAQHSSILKNALVILLSPVPILVLIITLDTQPLQPPKLGFGEQTIWVVVRFALTTWATVFSMTAQLHQSSPTLPFTSLRCVLVTVSVAIVMTALFCVLSATWIFPLPFPIQVSGIPTIPIYVFGLWSSWKQVLRTDPVAKDRITRYLPVFLVEGSLSFVYSLFNLGFRVCSADAQPFVALALPAMKLFFKTMISKGVFHMEDLAPVVIVFNMEVFHAVYVSSSMQQAQSGGSTAVIMVVDFVQSLIAYYEVNQILNRASDINTNCRRIRHGNQIGSEIGDREAMAEGPIAFAINVIDSSPAVQSHSEVALPRHLRPRPTSTPVASRWRIHTAVGVALQDEGRVDQTDAAVKGSSRQMKYASGLRSVESLRRPNLMQVNRQLESVTSILQILHMVEFYVLTEFAETLVAVFYTVYMFTIAHLPNRVYYEHLASLSQEELDTRVVQLATYAGLELLSFLLLCWAFDRRLRPFSTLQQLAFVLRKHAFIVQASMFMWVLVTVHIPFQHFGADYIFKLEWLHKSSGQ